MKITTVLVFSFAFSLFANNAKSQKVEITLNKQNISVDKVLTEIESQTDYLFMYNKSNIDVNRITSIKVSKEPVTTVLTKLFNGTNINFEITGRHIVLKYNDAVNQQKGRRKITGTVTDTNGEYIIGANIIEKETTNGVVTNIDGEFTIDVPDDAILQISYIGYINHDISLKNNKQSFYKVTLLEDSQSLDEVVVVGYGTQKKANVTGAVSTVNSKELVKAP